MISVEAMPLSVEERAMLQKLLMKAQEEETSSVDEDFRLVGDLPSGSMHDGSKRRGEFSLEGSMDGPPACVRVVSPSATDKAVPPVDTHQGYAFKGVPMSPMNHSELRMEMPPLPDGVPDMDTWGRTVIQWGLLKDAKKTYADVAASEVPRVKGYVKWIRPRVHTFDGEMRDLGEYLLRVAADGTQQGPIIPGTEKRRVLK